MLTGILLAGGKSERMGQKKAFLKFRGRKLYEFSLDILASYCDEILISSSDPAFHGTKHTPVKDEYPEMGPMGGIYSCLKKARNDYSLVLPCDLPLLDHKIIDIILKDYFQYDITVVLNENALPEPLIGIYSKSLSPVVERLLLSGKPKLMDLLSVANTRYIDLKKEGYQMKTHLFNNINNIEDYKELILKYGQQC